MFFVAVPWYWGKELFAAIGSHPVGLKRLMVERQRGPKVGYLRTATKRTGSYEWKGYLTMGSNLYWEPAEKRGHLLDGCKHILRKLYGEPIRVTLDEANIGELKGAKAAAHFEQERIELDELMKAIEKHGKILVEERW